MELTENMFNDDDVESVFKFIAAGGDINAIVYGTGETPLHNAVRTRAVRIVRLLLTSGANVNLAPLDSLQYTPLHTVIWTGNIEIAQMLIDYGADIYAKNYRGITPYDIARNLDTDKGDTHRYGGWLTEKESEMQKIIYSGANKNRANP